MIANAAIKKPAMSSFIPVITIITNIAKLKYFIILFDFINIINNLDVNEYG
jgi:hypothetical protein